LVILSVVDGLCRTDPGASGEGDVVPLVTHLDADTLALAGDSRSSHGTGGMRSKLTAARLVTHAGGSVVIASGKRPEPQLTAARLVTHAGGSVVIASGKRPEPLTRILGGEAVGTLFLARGATQAARKRWIGLTARPRGHFVVDAGARKALESGTKSLLAIGVVDVVGDFDKGDVVGVRDPSGHEFARGLSNYATADALQIRGLRTDQARQALGTALYDEVIHKDNLVLTC
jgi:glutamate 5-kinase